MDRIVAILRGIGDFVTSLFTSPSQSEGTYAETHYIDTSSFSARGPNHFGDSRETIRQYLDNIEGRPQDD